MESDYEVDHGLVDEMPTLGILLDGNRQLTTSNRFLCVRRLDRLTFYSMTDCNALLIIKICTMTAVRLTRLPGQRRS
jgi:hypothetical protein